MRLRVARAPGSLPDDRRTRRLAGPGGRPIKKSGRAWRVLVLLLAAPQLALAWGPQDHRTVGAIAGRLLTPRTQVAVAVLLQGDLDRYGNPSGRSTLEAVSVWADELSGTAAAHARWHYDNEPVCGAVVMERVCRGGDCGSVQLEHFIAVLGDRGASRRERNEALKWVVHLVGDLHQPLHAADNDDRGGNGVQVSLEGVRTRGRESLHRAWDNDLVKLALGTRNRQQVPPGIDALAREAQALVAQAGQGDPDRWVRESNNLARNVAYHYPGFACGSVPGRIVVLDARYIRQSSDLVRERLLLAGARLANLLNRVLGSP